MKEVFPLSIQSGMSQSGSYILMLCEPVSGLQVPIFIGSYEAQGILLAKESVQTRRPMTHELMVHVINDYGLSIKKVTIDSVMDGIFYATLHMTDGFNEKRFDSRTSDQQFWEATPVKTQSITIKVYVAPAAKKVDGCVGLYVGCEYSNASQFIR